MFWHRRNAQNRNRTNDTGIFSPLLYQLSYLGIINIFILLEGSNPIAGIGFEPTTSGLWARRASRLLYPAILKNGWGRIRTFESVANRFTVCPLWPLGNPSKSHIRYAKKPMIGLEPITCWLQISCSANWATSAKVLIFILKLFADVAILIELCSIREF